MACDAARRAVVIEARCPEEGCMHSQRVLRRGRTPQQDQRWRATRSQQMHTLCIAISVRARLLPKASEARADGPCVGRRSGTGQCVYCRYSRAANITAAHHTIDLCHAWISAGRATLSARRRARSLRGCEGPAPQRLASATAWRGTELTSVLLRAFMLPSGQ